MDRLLHRYRSLPRAAKWTVWATLTLIVFLVWDTGARMTQEFDARADAAAADIAQYQDLTRERRQRGGRFERGVSRHGEVAWPTRQSEREPAILDLVNSLVEQHDVPDGWSTSFKTTRLRGDAAERLFAPERVDRLICTFTFDASPGTLTQIIRAFEASPLIVGVNAINARVIDEDAERLTVSLDAESWVWEGGGRS
jgi:hypothetical protein